ncbi:hypothetical protein GUITHDRAFT_132369 [Guillardia theta CCMP2712]|uniref:Uncharacterized protein n=1 Tax=Guillardia theta (strain CCMP2712) TaxID=905079 RepID=L1K0F5_GUITC|nr:hypothetical protein GUITHDRAFT_132369 [Guillardia theta CCMP2712]EKX53930.1 hypothetical protein GUITHDRAFT_132369 [Guillardia theta CCMP2712]|eukprot:XP_005840910.1 hypothetical protein GUITHDRAFT_132369 [Guillardia theta CCMP2712]
MSDIEAFRRVADVLESFKPLLLDLRKEERDVNGKYDESVRAWKETKEAKTAAEVKRLLRTRNMYREALKDAIDAMTEVRGLLDEGLATRKEGGDAEAVGKPDNACFLEQYGAKADRVEQLLGEWRGRISMLGANLDGVQGSDGKERSNKLQHSHSTRSQLLRVEEEEIRRSCSKSAGKQILEVVRSLREVEGSLSFHSSLLAAQETIVKESSYTKDNFAYGSTPYHLSQCDDVKSTKRSNLFVVWGSSIGWFVFYANLTYGIVSRGVELLPTLHEIAMREMERNNLSGLSFTCGDLLFDELADVKILLLTSQCWDDTLRSPHPPGVQLGADGGCAQSRHRLSGVSRHKVSEVQGQVSWNDTQSFHIYRKQAAAGSVADPLAGD